jgi:hypothetical protein
MFVLFRLMTLHTCIPILVGNPEVSGLLINIITDLNILFILLIDSTQFILMFLTYINSCLLIYEPPLIRASTYD